MTISDNYGIDFFEMHLPWRCEYLFIADTLMQYLHFKTVADLGCGCGYIVQRMAEKGKSVLGIDGSEHAFPEADDVSFMVADLTKPLKIFSKMDLIICTEVGEHLEEQYADTLVGNICDNTQGLVFFSAAEPGYGGHLHLNEQPREYWITKFSQFGFTVDAGLTRAIKEDLDRWLVQTWWFPKNAFVLRAPLPGL